MDSLTLAQIENFDRVVAQRADEQSLPSNVQRDVVDASFHSRQRDRLLQLKRRCLRTNRRKGIAKYECDNCLKACSQNALHLVSYVKSSNKVTLSALVHTPTLPAFAKLSSVASITLLPSNVTVNLLPAKFTLRVCQTPDVTFVLMFLNATRLPLIV